MEASFILLGIGLAIIALRMYMRITIFGWRGLMVDDYLMLLVVAPYSAVTVLVYLSIVECNGLANDRMTPEERGSLIPGSEEWLSRTLGAKLVVWSRLSYLLTLWLTKAAMLAFYQRLTDRFGAYRWRIRVGFLLLGTTWLVNFLFVMLDCRPFSSNWQIQPDPGPHCYRSSESYKLFVLLSFNVATSLYVLAVPLPILWWADTKFWKKLGLVLLISGNGFVITIACLRAFFLTTTQRSGPAQADKWALNVCFVAVATTNLPLFFPIISRWIIALTAHSTNRQLRTISIRNCSLTITTRNGPGRRRTDSGVGLENELKLEVERVPQTEKPEIC
ncbi:hypothetical protein F4821DRAFT_281210 [Hypoxylon rubiginosum]|uniref:Uncharacterized protein n=1 Tax=Hypoxylon rubiginosum TaxID=110542 RepID=A0ACC0DET5_9PEZI|nr:hypothetical protein F4821DRAFT_281210 [Hypoxylon rubiginosum]